MRISSFASLASLLALFPLSSSVPTPESVRQRDDTLGNDALQLTALQEEALGAALAELDAQEESLKKRSETASCTRRNLEIRLE